MTPKDYKQIAGIIKKEFDSLVNIIEDYKTNVMNAGIITAYSEEEHKARCMGYDDVLQLLVNKRKELANRLDKVIKLLKEINDSINNLRT